MNNPNGVPSGIMQFSEDLSNAEAPPPLPPGQYTAEIISATPKVSATSGNPYLNLVFRIPASEYPADYQGDPDGVVLPFNRTLLVDTQQGRYRMRKLCEATGAPMGRTLDISNFVGLAATVEVVHDKWEGEDRAQIARVMQA